MALQEQLRTVLGSRQPTPEEAVPLALHVLMCAAGFVARDGHGNALPGCEPPADWTENSKCVSLRHAARLRCASTQAAKCCRT